MTNDVLKVRDLKTRFFTEEGQVNAVDGISFDLKEKEVLAIVGESGSGKSVTSRSILDLVESPGEITDGEIWYHSPELVNKIQDHTVTVEGEYVDLRTVSPAVRRSLRGNDFSVILQEPGSSFNPNLTVGEQIAEAVECAHRLKNGENYSVRDLLRDNLNPYKSFISDSSRQKAIELLTKVDIPDPVERASEYPHQFSGGMLQRAMIAQAIAADPTVLIADEPTTGLDVTIQEGILSLLEELQNDTGMSILLITHNLGVVSRLADRTAIMYAGEFLELGPTEKIFTQPSNPYTKGLLNSIPNINEPTGSVEPLPGNVPSLLDHEMPTGCSFAPRCPDASPECRSSPPPQRLVDDVGDHRVTCVHAGIENTSPELNSEPTEPVDTYKKSNE